MSKDQSTHYRNPAWPTPREANATTTATCGRQVKARRTTGDRAKVTCRACLRRLVELDKRAARIFALKQRSQA